ncbi:unnamed protein product [Calypogeia fissa]
MAVLEGEEVRNDNKDVVKENDPENANGAEGSADVVPAGGDGGPGAAGAGDGDDAIIDEKEKGKKEKAKEPMVSFFRLFTFADKFDYVLMAGGSIGAIVHGAALPIFFLFFGKLLNGLGENSGSLQGASTHTIDKYSMYYLWLGLAVLGSSWLEVSFWMQTGDRQAAKLRTKYLESLLQQDVGFFDTDTNTGDFVSSIASDPLMVQDAISEKVGNFQHYISTFVAGFIVGFTNEWRIALVTVAIVPLIAISGGFYAYSLTTSSSRAAGAYSEAGSIAEQSIAQVRTVYSFVSESKFIKAYSTALEKTFKYGAQAGLAKGLGMGVTYGVLFCCWALLLWYGGILVRKGTVNGGTALAAIFSVIIGGLALGQAVPNLTAFARGKVAAYKIFLMIDHEPQINKPDPTAETLEKVDGRIELRRIDFVYPSRPDVHIFKDFSLTIPAGKTVAIVGSSGSGKSTVVSLIERFYDPISGEVLLDDHDIKKLDVKWLRAQIGLVNQEPALFATTIGANILYGKDNATQEEIEAAAKASNAHGFIDQLPLKYETQVGERGIQLSGGQKQRVAIARAMLKNPAVLLLDEATSALDAGSEQTVQEALDRLMVGRTTIVVAHRLSTIRNAESIAVVQEGRIVERGTHDELIARPDGAYSALVRLQEMAAAKDTSMKRSSSRTSYESRLSRGGGSYRAPGSLSITRSGPLSMQKSGSSRSAGDPKQGEAGDVLDGKDLMEPKSKGSLTRLFIMSKDEWVYGIAGTIGSMLAGCLNPAFALIIAEVLTAYYNKSHSKMRKDVSTYALIFVALGVAAPFIYVLQHYSLGVVGERLVKRVRELMLTGILRNEMGWFDREENNSGQILARLNADATNVRAAIGDRVSVIVQNTTLLLVACIFSLSLQWKLALVMLSTFPLFVFAAFGENMFLKGFSGDVNKAYSRASRVAGEAVSNIRTVAAFNAEKKVQALFATELEGPSSRSFWRGQVAGLGFGISQLFMYGAYGLGLWYSGQLENDGSTKFGPVIKVFLILIVTAFAVAETLALTPDLVKGGQAVESVFEVLDRKTKIEPEDPNGLQVEKIVGDIELKRVEFAYPSRPDVTVFKSLSLKVRSGHSLALVGASGSGKSSVIALIERFYDPLSGQVLIDGKDLKSYNLKSVRKHIALVSQEPTLYSDTISGNILYGREGATEAEVIEAGKAANAHNFISALPEGYNTEVGERGIQLSGGQKQRVAIARAVLKNPAILLLDEATSALDAESEKIVQEALDRLMKGRTTVVIAHRLSTIRGADTIAVVQEGNILEEGTHSELLAKGGGYARLINIQNRTHEAKSESIE